MGDMTGSELARCLRRAQAGDLDALGRLLEQYRAYLALLARSQIGPRLASKVDASDVVQETFYDASRDFTRFRGSREHELIAWLREILAANLADQVRRHYGTQQRDVRLERRFRDSLDASSQALGRGLVSPGSSPSHRAARREQAVLAADALARLPEHYQDVLILRHIEGLSFPEIAERMDRSLASVKSLWTRALEKLRCAFGDQR